MSDKQKNIAYYLKYRPQSLDGLVGQDNVKKTLLNSFNQQKLSHAYLFAGPRGTGKTSTARILAKMVNCLAKENIPCNECITCLSITDGSNLDLIEIDAASNRGVEDIRDLRDKIKLAPSSSKKKVYILDEAHMLTTEAFNALLKTLEEPPSHALFILATTDAQKLPQTILSRVQRLDFKLASPDELLTALQKITTSEKIDIEEEALKLLIKKSEGSFRDGIKFLDQLSSTGEKITVESLQKSLKSSNIEIILAITQSLSKKDTTFGLSQLIKQVELGVDIKELTLSLMDALRSLVFIKNELGEQLVKPNLAEDDYQQLEKVSSNFSNKDLVQALNILQNALEKLKFASIPSLPLELAMVEICNTNQEKVSPIVDQQIKTEIKVSQLPPQEALEVVTVESSVPDISSELTSSSDDIVKLKEKWTFVLETVRAFNFSLEALLRSINIKECTQSSIIMEVPYSFHQRILEAPKNRDLIESVLSDILGRSIQVSTTLGARPQRKEDVANIEVAADDEIIRAAAEIFNSDSIN